MSKIWTVAVVGCGVGRSHVAAFSAHPDKFRVVAVCDPNEERLAAAAEEHGVERRVRDFGELLRMDDIEIIDLATPPFLHREQALAALAAGRHVVCEKPVVGSLAELDELAEAERNAKGRVLPVFQYRYGDGAQKAKRLIDLGIAGRAYLSTVETAWKRTMAYYEGTWRGRWETELGGVLVTHAIHQHDMLNWLVGPVASIYAQTTTRVNPIEVEDCATASAVMADGSLASLSATLGSQKEITRLRFCFENITFESTPGPYNPGEGPWQILPASEEVGQRIEAALDGWVPVRSRFEGLFAAYHAALEGEAAFPVALTDARRSLELLTAMFHSAATGEVVRLPIGADHPRYSGWGPR